MNSLGQLGIVEPISAAAVLAISAWMARRGPQQKLASTAIVNELEPLLQSNVDDYLAGPRTAEAQAVHVAQFDLAWNWLKSREGCGNEELGRPGQNCISDRSRGGRWDWTSYYRDPIANDVPAPDAAAAAAGAEQVQPSTGRNGVDAAMLSGGINNTGLLLLVLLAAGLWSLS